MSESFNDRLAARRALDARRLSGALKSIAAILRSAPEDDAARSDDPLQGACQRVLRALGLRVGLPADREGGDLRERLERIAKRAGAALRAVTLESEPWWRDAAWPLLVFRKADHRPLAFCVSAAGPVLHDPVTLEDVPLTAAAAAELEPSAYMFFRGFAPGPVGLRALLRFALAGNGGYLRRTALFGLAAGVLGLAVPIASGALVNTVIPDALHGELLQLVLLLACIGVGLGAFELLRGYAMLRIQGNMDMSVQAALVSRLVKLPAGFFRAHETIDLARRTLATAQIITTLTETVQAAVLGWIFGLVGFGYMLVLDWRLSLLGLAIALIPFSFTVFVNLRRLPLERAKYELNTPALQLFTGIAKIRGRAAERRAFAIWGRYFEHLKRLDFGIRRWTNRQAAFDAGYPILAALAIYLGIALADHPIGTGTFVAFNTAFMQFLASTLALAMATTQGLQIVPLYERAAPVLGALPEESPHRHPPGALRGEIEVSNLSFRYDQDGPPALQNVSLHVQPGEFVAIVGPSGSGKSTLFRLLLGFETPDAGAVYYDGKDLKTLDTQSVRRQLGVVIQNGKLLPGSVFTNIVGSAALTHDDAWEAARMAGLEEDIKAMPMGMHTLIAEGAGTISGGQRQRLMIARAIVKHPRILLFDEATSALDNRTQAIVARSLEQLRATRVVIAHRLSTIERADRIVVLEAGQVVEVGSYRELMAKEGAFAALARRQII